MEKTLEQILDALPDHVLLDGVKEEFLYLQEMYYFEQLVMRTVLLYCVWLEVEKNNDSLNELFWYIEKVVLCNVFECIKKSGEIQKANPDLYFKIVDSFSSYMSIDHETLYKNLVKLFNTGQYRKFADGLSCLSKRSDSVILKARIDALVRGIVYNYEYLENTYPRGILKRYT